jgi:hypothetical protein
LNVIIAALQTKGVKSIVSIEPSNAAWYAAVGAVGAAIIGTGELGASMSVFWYTMYT